MNPSESHIPEPDRANDSHVGDRCRSAVAAADSIGHRQASVNGNGKGNRNGKRSNVKRRELGRPGRLTERRWLTALPVYNEVDYVDGVLDKVLQFSDHVLVVNDGSNDGTAEKLRVRRELDPGRLAIVDHPTNLGYGAALQNAFRYTLQHRFEGVVTLDCDGQHQPHRIPRFIEAAAAADIVSGSRYLKDYEGDDAPPQERMFINRRLTGDLNRRLGLSLTDAFCGFKAYRAEGLARMKITDPGYAMPLQLWVEAVAAGLRVIELPVPRIYLDLARSFGGSLDHAETRLNYYNRVLDEAIQRARTEGRWQVSANRDRLAGA